MPISDDEIDLRPYLVALIRNWWIILILVALTAAAGYFYSSRQPQRYSSTATVIVTRSRPTLSIAEQFPTLSDPVDSKSKIQAFLAIANSDAIAQSVYESLPESTSSKYSLGNIKNSVTIRNNGDAIEITASARDPLQATEIANTWAEESTRAINLAYGRGRSITESESQITASQERYQAAQKDLEAFIQNNQLSILESQVQQARRLLENLTANRVWRIDYYNQRIRLMEQVIIQAEALKQQVKEKGQSTAGEMGDALAVLLARAETFGIQLVPTDVTGTDNEGVQTQNTPSEGLRFDIQLDALASADASAKNYAADLDRLIQRAEAEKAKAEKSLGVLGEGILNGEENEQVQQTAARIRDLETQKESESARRKELTGERDLAWEAYSALLQKETEGTTAADTSNEVSLASPAVTPHAPVPKNAHKTALVGAVLGAALGIFLILGAYWWRSSGLSQSLVSGSLAKSAHIDK